VDIPNVVLPVFAVILTGWLAGAVGYLPRTLSAPLVGFAYNVAMPALIFVTIAPEPVRGLLNWGFLVAFGGGSLLCFAAVFLAARARASRGLGSSAMLGATASMTNTGFVALPILQAMYGPRGVLPAAIATVFVAVAMFPILIVLLEMDRARSDRLHPLALANRVVTNPLMISTILGLVWSIGGLPVPAFFKAYATIFADALTPCALFSIGLGLSLGGLRGDLVASAWLTVLKLVIMPLAVYGLCMVCRVDAFHTVAAVVCAAVPTAKTAYVLAGEYRVEERMVASTISITTLLSVVTLLGWLYALS
jgi:predicted permease